MKIDPRHLIQLAATVEAGGVTEGAALIGTTQPAVSRTIAQLEKRLGEPLFLRGKRPIQPTPLCLALAEQGAMIRIASLKAGEAVALFRRGESGVVRVGGTPFFTDALIAGMVADFQSANPRIRVDQCYGYPDELIALVRAGRLDIAICPMDLLDPDSDLAFTELLPGRNVVACRSGHPLTRTRPLRTRHLLDYPWIAPPPGSPLNQDLRRAVLAIGVDRIRIAYSGGSLASVVNHMRRSDCLTVLPHSVVFAMRQDDAVTALPLDIEHPNRSLGVLHAKEAMAPAVKRLVAHVADSFASLREAIRRHEQVVVWGGERPS